MKLLYLSRGATHGYGDEYQWACYSVEQAQAARPEAPTETKRDLGHPDSAAIGSSSPRTCIVQPRHRQQVARVRSSRTSRMSRTMQRPIGAGHFPVIQTAEVGNEQILPVVS